ncbi:MAG: TlpA family protein disulfide reductase [Acidobacteria bacterium]|nr:TlpA family protein disulfide reductase [Acidobacteriota bacterium]
MKGTAFALLLWLLQGSVEEGVTAKLRTLIQPGQPLIVSNLYNEVFTSAAERQVLDRLFNVFFKIPIYIVQEYETRGRSPSLQDLAQQFRLAVPGQADLLLAIMEADPRVPRFFRRDPATGEIGAVDPAALRADPNFSAQLERSLVGLEGRVAPDFTLQTFNGPALTLSSLRGRSVLLYFWFTDCPPCTQISDHLVALQQQYSARGFTVVGLNADRILELPHDDAYRAAYVGERRLNFPNVHLDSATQSAYGDISIFPTLFLVRPDGVVQRQFVSYQSREVLEEAVRKAFGN